MNWSQKPKSHKWLIVGVITLSILLLLLGIYFLITRTISGTISPLGEGNEVEEQKEEVMIPNPINGIMTPESEVKSWENRYPIGVMIENLNITRPQTGLSRADIVYEALTEGEITRFMAVYLSEDSSLGPVRSARLPYLSWILEYDGALAHVGGSTEALEQIPALRVKDMDQGRIGEPTFQRINNRGLSLEHTVFTTAQKLWDKARDLGYKGVPTFSSWKFKDDAPRENRPETQKLTLRFTGNPSYIAAWTYDPETNLYARSNGGIPHLEGATQEVIKAKNVIVQFVKTNFQEVTPGKVGRGMETVGRGEVRIFRDGISVSGTWEKTSPQARTRFLDETGKEIELNRGKIWVEVNPTDTPIEYN
jgi:hypothetical protein